MAETMINLHCVYDLHPNNNYWSVWEQKTRIPVNDATSVDKQYGGRYFELLHGCSPHGLNQEQSIQYAGNTSINDSTSLGGLKIKA